MLSVELNLKEREKVEGKGKEVKGRLKHFIGTRDPGHKTRSRAQNEIPGTKRDPGHKIDYLK